VISLRLSDLQSKNIVNISDGRNIGTIMDVKIDENTGAIVSLILEANKSFFSFSNRGVDTEVNWKNIEKIGEDVILVNTTL